MTQKRVTLNITPPNIVRGDEHNDGHSGYDDALKHRPETVSVKLGSETNFFYLDTLLLEIQVLMPMNKCIAFLYT